jgi:hypothetical protein
LPGIADQRIDIDVFDGLTVNLMLAVHGLKAVDPATLTVAGVVLAMVGATAGFLPAHRAARLDPMTTLREE